MLNNLFSGKKSGVVSFEEQIILVAAVYDGPVIIVGIKDIMAVYVEAKKAMGNSGPALLEDILPARLDCPGLVFLSRVIRVDWTKQFLLYVGPIQGHVLGALNGAVSTLSAPLITPFVVVLVSEDLVP